MTFEGMVGKSEAMQAVFALLARAAASETPVVIEGETGTGKDVSAEAIHREGRRRDRPFVVVDCGDKSGRDLASVLFGYERGAFWGALTAGVGAFEAAAGGTIVLDEIAEIGLDLQPKILRAIETRRIKRIGSATFTPTDVRVIGTTSRNMRIEIAARRFRNDLYHRLSVVNVHLPPLRQRSIDIPILVEYILEQLGVRDTNEAKALRSTVVLSRLAAHDWPGNVRQLRTHVERCVALGDANLPITEIILPLLLTGANDPAMAALHMIESLRAPSQESSPHELDLTWKEARQVSLADLERRYIEGQLIRHHGNLSAAARAAGISRLHFYRLLWKHRARSRNREDKV